MSIKETILIIEDNQLNLDMARDLLERAGFLTLEAEDADKGIRLAKEKQPNLILMDMHLPILNGYEASKILKADLKTQDIPIVGFTALAMKEDEKKAIEYGCMGVIAKPINVDRFAEMVAAYLPIAGTVVTMPKATAEIVTEKINSAPIKPPVSRCYKILIVDDRPQNRELLGDILIQMNQPYVSARNGQEALYLAKEEKPDLILLDIMMPGMDGYEVFDRLKADPVTAEIPVIFVSALNKTENIVKGLQKGGIDYITKPLQMEEVIARITAALRTKLFQDALYQKIEEAEKAKQDLEEFLLIASHDLQSPLRKIQRFHDFMDKADPDSSLRDNQEMLNGIGRNAQEMESLLQDLLTLSRISRKGNPFTPVSLMDVLTNVLSKYQTSIRETGATIELVEMCSLEADFNQMEMLFDILIDNALKFKQEVPPLIRIHCRVLKDACEITIEDNGIGFDEKHADRIFKPFQRLHGASKYSGSGIGLAIAKKIVERHQGMITAKSTIGKGSTFVVAFPLK